MATVDKKKVLWREVADQTVILRMETGFSYSLDGAARLIWSGVVMGKSSEEIAAELSRAYAIDERTSKQDVQAFLEDLCKEGLIDP